MLAEQTAPTLRLVAYFDLRPIDWATGKRMPLEPGEGHVCHRCGREHAKVYVLQEGCAGPRFSVGETCAKRTTGFSASAIELRQARRDERDRMDAKRLARVKELAEPIRAARLAACPPTPALIEVRSLKDGEVEIWGADGVTTWVIRRVQGQPAVFDEERVQCFRDSWIHERVTGKMLVGLPEALRWDVRQEANRG